MTQTVQTTTVETSDEYFAQAEDEIERFAASGGSPAVVSILSLLLKGSSARAPSTPSPSSSAAPIVPPTTISTV